MLDHNEIGLESYDFIKFTNKVLQIFKIVKKKKIQDEIKKKINEFIQKVTENLIKINRQFPSLLKQ